MKRDKSMSNDPDMLEEYDFSKGVRGKYAKRYEEGCNVIVIEPDVSAVFPDAGSVNQALRAIAQVVRNHDKKTTKADH
ncbi:MAG: hypothetical protein ACC651_02050 [Candidatus Scalindua sp.]